MTSLIEKMSERVCSCSCNSYDEVDVMLFPVEQAVVHETPGIRRCFVHRQDGKMQLVTEGVNIQVTV